MPPSSAVLPSPSSCAALPIADGQPPNDFAAAVNQVTAKAQLLVREEIELAKVEVTEKITSLTKGGIVAIAAGVFVVAGLLFLGHAVAWGLYALFFNDVAWGYLIVAGSLFVLGGSRRLPGVPRLQGRCPADAGPRHRRGAEDPRPRRRRADDAAHPAAGHTARHGRPDRRSGCRDT